MSFGLTNASATFMKNDDWGILAFLDSFITTFINDVMVYSHSKKDYW